MRLRYRIPLAVIAIFMVLTLFMASSYALWKVTIYQETENIIETGCFSIEFQDKSSSINLGNTYPMSDTNGMKTVPYVFTLKNTCTVDANYTLYLNTLEVDGVKLADNLIKYSLVKEGGAVATAQKLSTATPNIDKSHFTYTKNILNSYELGTGSLKGKTSEDSDDGGAVTYSLRLWIDESGKNAVRDKAGNIVTPGIDGQTFEAGISTIATATKLEAE